MKASTLQSKEVLKVQPPPHSIKLELTEGCNFYCKFCGIKSIRKGPGNFKFLKMEVLESLIDKIVRAGIEGMKFDCAMHGEPLMNKNYLKIFKFIRKEIPMAYVHVTTNGAPLLKGSVTDNVDALLQYVNFINLDDYKNYGISDKVLDSYKGNYPVSTFPKVNVYAKQLHEQAGLVIFPDISQIRTKRKLHNQASNAFPKDFLRLKKRCHRPFREMAVKYDGSVILCCNDWQAKFVVGNVLSEDTLSEIYNYKKFRAARRILFHDGRNFSICYGCNEYCYRVGLLPDRFGKYTIKKPTEKDYELVGGRRAR